MSIRKLFISFFSLCLFCLAVSCQKDRIEDRVPEDEDQQGEVTPPEPPAPESKDGCYASLLEATKGKGLDIVILGDGFTEEDIESGRYDAVMEGACRHLFSQEPTKSLKDYFNVWCVYVVSDDSSLSGKSGLKCNGVNPGKETEAIIDRYAGKVAEIVADSTVFCVIINSTKNGGWTTHASYNTQKGYAFCPMIQSTPANQYYKLALIHETIGHGFAKMGDEYVMSGYNNVSPGTKDISDLRYAHRWYYDLNITYSKDPQECPWKDFLSDERYAGENIGFFEGVGYFGRGAYRPTQTNMMNTTWGAKMEFSAPQRKIIFDRVIRRGEGRIPTYEEFVAFDGK